MCFVSKHHFVFTLVARDKQINTNNNNNNVTNMFSFFGKKFKQKIKSLCKFFSFIEYTI